MRARLMFRENGHVIRTQSSTLTWLWGASVALGLVLLLGMAGGMHTSTAQAAPDAQDDARLEALLSERLAPSVREAYAQGLRAAGGCSAAQEVQ